MSLAHEPVRSARAWSKLRPAASNQIKSAGQLIAGLVAVSWIPGETTRDDAIERDGNCGVEFRRWNGVHSKNLRANFAERISGEWPDSRNHLVQDDPQREKIGASVLRSSFNLLWRKISGRAKHAVRS